MFGAIRMIVNVIFFIIEALLMLRFILILFAANTAGTFAEWIFTNSAVLISPFKNIFPTVDLAGLTVDFAVLFALIIYLVINQLIVRVLYFVESPRGI